jgi:hypothetical protein
MKREVTMRDLWENKEYLRLKCNVQSLMSLQAVTNSFIREDKDLAAMVVLKSSNHAKRPCAHIADIDRFVEAFNQLWDKKQSEKSPVFSGFSETLRDCFEQKCNCKSCFYNSFDSLRGRCVMKSYVKAFVDQYGAETLIAVGV